MPDNTLTFGELLIVISTVVPKLQSAGLMDVHGGFTQGAVSNWARFAADIESELKQYLLVPAKVDAVLAALPLLLQLVGVR